jgi:hypothetical protein
MLVYLLLCSGVLVASLLVIGVFIFYVYYWLIQRPVPKLDGTLGLDCL